MMQCCLEISSGYAAWLAMLSIDMLAGYLVGYLLMICGWPLMLGWLYMLSV
jgi:hypothetical protein